MPDRELVDMQRLAACSAEAGGTALAAFRDALQHGDAVLREAFETGEPIEDLVHGRARLIDTLLMHMWRCSGWAEDADAALIAVGGYGRGELHPASDIDILILLEREPDKDTGARIEYLLTLMWDCGLKAGHAVRTLAQCECDARGDITVATNLLEARRIAGSEPLCHVLADRLQPTNVWPAHLFFQAKVQEQTTRHRKYRDTAHNLEPNLKESPGGLRDIQTISWVARRHFGSGALEALVQHGFLTQQEGRTLHEGRAYLWRLRFALHVMTGRGEDRLLFEHQRALAEHFGYRDSNANLAVEQFMKGYYRTAMTLQRLNEMLLQLFREAILRPARDTTPQVINARFHARQGYLALDTAQDFRRTPYALLELFLLLQKHPELQGVRAETIRRIRDHCPHIDDEFRQDPRNRALFMDILRQARGVADTLRRMSRYGVLPAYLPAFGQVAGQMQFDLFHAYTVDEHSLILIENLERFTRPDSTDEAPNCHRIMQRIPKRELLYLAGLFHDLAKGRGGDHSELGAEDAETFCLEHGLSGYDTRLVQWLVRHHLLLSLTAQRKDISDPAVVQAFAEQVGTAERLDYLYLLTVADIQATNPKLWNAWRSALLLELYGATRRVLRRGLNHPIDERETIAETQTAARALLDRQAVSTARVDAVWRDFGDDYFLRHSADEIAWHTEAVSRADAADLPVVLVRQETARGTTEIFVYADVHDRLFGITTSTLDQLGLTIVEARIISSASGCSLNTYLVLEQSGEPIREDYRVEEIRRTLRERLSRPETAPATVHRRTPRQFRAFSIPTEITFLPDERNRRTIIELNCADRPGLLSDVAHAFVECGVQIQNAKIATIGARAEDIFFVTDADGQTLDDPDRQTRLRAAIEHNVTRSDPPPPGDA